MKTVDWWPPSLLTVGDADGKYNSVLGGGTLSGYLIGLVTQQHDGSAFRAWPARRQGQEEEEHPLVPKATFHGSVEHRD
jgi:hypothetical protein